MTDDKAGAIYRFESVWVLAAQIEEVYELLIDPGDTTSTPMVRSTVVNTGDRDGLGRRADYRIRSPLLYTMRLTAEVTEVAPPRRLHSEVFGDLEGTGTYHLTPEDGTTRVRFDWQVRTTKPWMNLFYPIGRPLFVWAHNRVMDDLIRAMAQHLGATLISSTSRLMSEQSENL